MGLIAPRINPTPPQAFGEIFRLTAKTEKNIREHLAEYERKVLSNTSQLDGKDITSAIIKENTIVRFFIWFDTLIRGANSPAQRKTNEERFLSLFDDYKETGWKIKARASHPEYTELEFHPKVSVHSEGLRYSSLIDELTLRGFTKGEVIEVFAWLDRLITTSDSPQRREINRNIFLKALDPRIKRVICEHLYNTLEQKEKEILGGIPISDYKKTNLQTYRLKEEDINLARENIDTRCAFLIAQHIDYPIDKIDEEIRAENPESLFANGLAKNIRYSLPRVCL